jgi:phosphopantothenoylcysteine decarboxylase/phosphopantothenate--cysteine ligase
MLLLRRPLRLARALARASSASPSGAGAALLAHFPPVSFAAAYGSAVLPQAGYSPLAAEADALALAASAASAAPAARAAPAAPAAAAAAASASSPPMLDLIFAVEDPLAWHAANLRRNRAHYSGPIPPLGAAAVADYRPTQCADRKIKKTSDCLDITLTRAPDILSSVAALAQRPFVVGFAAETNDVERNARDKLERKKLDMIAANDVSEGRAFDRDDNALVVLWADGKRQLNQQRKSELADELVAVIAERYLLSARAHEARSVPA